MQDADYYRARARLCRIEASRSNSGQMRRDFLATAKVWDSMADRADKLAQLEIVTIHARPRRHGRFFWRPS